MNPRRKAEKAIRVALADDQCIVREGVRGLLAAEPGVEVVGEAADAASAIELAERLAPDLLVLDIALPGGDGIEVVRRLHAQRPGVRVVVLSAHCDRHTIQEALRAGVSGYVTKRSSREDLVRAIRCAASGQSFLSPDVARTMVSDYINARSKRPPPASCLGERERHVLRLIADGEHSSQIAVHLGIAVATVDVHRRNLMRKLDLHTVAALTRYAIREGLTQP